MNNGITLSPRTQLQMDPRFNLVNSAGGLTSDYNFSYNGYHAAWNAYDTLTAVKNEIIRCQKNIEAFEKSWWFALSIGFAGTGIPIACLHGPPQLFAIWRFIGDGNMYLGIQRQNEYHECKGKLPTLYAHYETLIRSI